MSGLAARALAPPGPASARWEALGTTVVLRLADAGRHGARACAPIRDPHTLAAARARAEHELDAIDRACSRFRADSELTQVNAAASGEPGWRPTGGRATGGRATDARATGARATGARATGARATGARATGGRATGGRATGGRAIPISPLLVEALQLALRAAELTGGDVDPTVGAALHLAGYDRDWRLLQAAAGPGFGANAGPGVAGNAGPGGAGNVIPLPPRPRVRAQLRAGHRTVRLDPVRRTVSIPRGVALDLGATAKAWAADRAARAVHAAVGCGALVSVGGDIATAGPAPAGGWPIHVTDDHRAGPGAPGQTITIASGGLATSSTTVRRWRRGGTEQHHIIDPARGVPARGPWRTVSVAAADCADANIATTAALVRGERAVAWLQELGVPARLVAHDGTVLALGGWPPAPPEDPRQARSGRRPDPHARIEATTHVDDPR